MSTRTQQRPAEPATAISLQQAAKVMGQSVPTIRRLVRRGELPHCRVGRRVVLLEDDVFRFLRSRRVEAHA
jgi:excisionase family DNA binding protein